MKTQSPDTSPAAEAVYFALLRRRTPGERLAIAGRLTRMTRAFSWYGLRRTHPEAGEDELRARWCALIYSADLAARYMAAWRERQAAQAHLTMPPPNVIPADVVEPLLPLIAALEQCGIAYYIGGSIASSVWGDPRSTNDADLVADIQPAQVAPFVALIEADYYVDAPAIYEAIRQRRSFNVIHMEHVFKIDIFTHPHTPFAEAEFATAQAAPIATASPQTVRITSAENTILHKLVWYRRGGETSERQWRDILGVLKAQTSALDQAYLQEWAARLQVTDLLARARADAGLDESSIL